MVREASERTGEAVQLSGFVGDSSCALDGDGLEDGLEDGSMDGSVMVDQTPGEHGQTQGEHGQISDGWIRICH